MIAYFEFFIIIFKKKRYIEFSNLFKPETMDIVKLKKLFKAFKKKLSHIPPEKIEELQQMMKEKVFQFFKKVSKK